MTERSGNLYLVIFKIDPATPERLADFVPKATSVLANLSTTGIEQAFRSMHADIFGWVFRSNRNVHMALRLIETPTDVQYPAKPLGERFMTNKDHAIVFELGDECAAASGFSRLTTWIQNH